MGKTNLMNIIAALYVIPYTSLGIWGISLLSIFARITTWPWLLSPELHVARRERGANPNWIVRCHPVMMLLPCRNRLTELWKRGPDHQGAIPLPQLGRGGPRARDVDAADPPGPVRYEVPLSSAASQMYVYSYHTHQAFWLVCA